MSKITNDGLTRSGTGCFIAIPVLKLWARQVVNRLVWRHGVDCVTLTRWRRWTQLNPTNDRWHAIVDDANSV